MLHFAMNISLSERLYWYSIISRLYFNFFWPAYILFISFCVRQKDLTLLQRQIQEIHVSELQLIWANYNEVTNNGFAPKDYCLGFGNFPFCFFQGGEI